MADTTTTMAPLLLSADARRSRPLGFVFVAICVRCIFHPAIDCGGSCMYLTFNISVVKHHEQKR